MKLPDSAEVHLLTQIGFIAAGHGDARRALRIFEALALARPQRAFAFVGIASALMNAGRAAEAVQRLQSVKLPAGAEADMLEVFKSLALQLAGRPSESTYLLKQVVARNLAGPPSEGGALAAQMLGTGAPTAQSTASL